MMLAARGAFLAARRKPRLPYDAEVEYLESTGTQWIDTDFLPKAGDVIRGRFYSVQGKYSGFFGTCGLSYANAWGVFRTSNDWTGFMRRGYGIQGVLQVSGSVTTDVVQTISNYTVFGTTRRYTGASGTQDWDSADVDATYPLSIFSIRDPNRSTGYIVVSNGLKCMYLQVLRGGATVADYIPVRFTNEQGQSEGAMYDRANPTVGMNPDGSPRKDGLYRNRGTGSFVIGPDKTA